MRAVLDANVIVSAVGWPTGPPRRLVELHAQGAFELVVSPKLIGELEAVLNRPHLLSRIAGSIDDFLIRLCKQAVLLNDIPTPGTRRLSDPDDEYLVDLATNAKCPLVSGDRAVLALVDDLPVYSPRAFLELLEETGHSRFSDSLPTNLTRSRFEVLLERARQQTRRELLTLDENALSPLR